MTDSQVTDVVPSIVVHDSVIEVQVGSVVARVQRGAVRFGHLGCKLLGTLENIPADVADRWDREFGRRSVWKKKDNATERLGYCLKQTAEQAQVNGLVLWDTMRNGSDYWRPGGLLSKAARHAGCPVTFERDDDFCPPSELLARFSQDQTMTFGEYAQGYATYLHATGSVLKLAAAVLMALARGRLAIFYCVDPYIPGYGKLDPTGLAYDQRPWPTKLREEGCHRVILAEEVVRFFLAQSTPIALFEVDQTFDKVHVRKYT